MEMKISFLVPTLGARENEMRRLLDSLVTQTYEKIEVVVVAQDNYECIMTLLDEYSDNLNIVYVQSKERGLSKARNIGLMKCTGDIIVLSDDDCWYNNLTAEMINNSFQNSNLDIFLSKIYDYKNECDYKKYANKIKNINNVFGLLSRSSIEIAFRRETCKKNFDELFGLGAHFVCGEEVDFLINMYGEKKNITFSPVVTVYHERKTKASNYNQVIAKGALYAKHFNCIIGILICLKDLIIRRENNFKAFFRGFNEYKQIERDIVNI